MIRISVRCTRAMVRSLSRLPPRSTVLLAPHPEWVRGLPNAKLPDRKDFVHYGQDLQGRMRVWTAAASASEQLADEFAAWLRRPDMGQVLPL